MCRPRAVDPGDLARTLVARAAVYVPGLRRDAPKRNALVLLAYLACVLSALGAAGVL